MLFFFFKQKTAYEMRISDWSSDVCSSDLRRSTVIRHCRRNRCYRRNRRHPTAQRYLYRRQNRPCRYRPPRPKEAVGHRRREGSCCPLSARRLRTGRSEEHTSELQSLMRNSYAVFCLKKTNTNTYNQTTIHETLKY